MLKNIPTYQWPHSNQFMNVSEKFFKFSFNLGLGSPKNNVCSFCERVRNQIKAEKNTERKKSLMTDLVVHKKRIHFMSY